MKELLARFKPQFVLQGVHPGRVISINVDTWSTDNKGRLESIQYRDPWNVVQVRSDGSLKRTNLLIESPPPRLQFIAKLLQQYFRWRQIRNASAKSTWLNDSNETCLDYGWQLAKRAILLANKLTRAHDAIHVIFTVPTDVQVNEAEWENLRGFRDAAVEYSLDFELAKRRFREASSAAQWVDLLPTF